MNIIIPPWITCFAGEKCTHKSPTIINFTQPDTKHLNGIQNEQMFCVCPDVLHLQISCTPFSALLYLHSNKPSVTSFHCMGCYIVYHRVMFGLESTVVYYCDIQQCGVYSLSVMLNSPQLTWDLKYSLQVHLGKLLQYITSFKSKTSHWSSLKQNSYIFNSKPQ